MMTAAKNWRKLSYHHANLFIVLFKVYIDIYYIQKWLCARRECMAVILHSNSDLYLKTDVLLLYLCRYLRIFGIVASRVIDSILYIIIHYRVLRGMLKYSRVNFEFLTDADMLLFIERVYAAIWVNVQTGMRRPTISMHAIIRNHT